MSEWSRDLEAEVARLRRALVGIAEYGSTEGHLLDERRWPEAMRTIARNALWMDPGCSLCGAGHVPARACAGAESPVRTAERGSDGEAGE